MPQITMLYSNQNDYVTTEIVSESVWTDCLVESGAITTMNDDSLIQSLSNFYMMFHSYEKNRSTRCTLHSLQIDKQAVFNVDRIMRPTEDLKESILEIQKQSNSNKQWASLLHLWNEFGYFWPRKIMLGYRQHLSKSYTFSNNSESTGQFYKALEYLKQAHGEKERMKANLEYEFLNDCSIVARLDLAPLHDFFSEPYRSMVYSMIQLRFTQIVSNKPIQVYNVATDSFLCWDPMLKQRMAEKDHRFLIRSIPAEQLKEVDISRYLWKLSWSPFTEKQAPTEILNGSSKVYIQPADPLPQHPPLPLTMLSCRPAKYDEMSTQELHFSRIKALRLLVPDAGSYEKSGWSLEYPNNRLKYVTDYQQNLKLNINEHLRRIKPVLEGDDIQFQQVGLLTAFYPVEKTAHGHLLKPNASSRNNVLCIDEDIIQERYGQSTIWRIQFPEHTTESIPSISKVFGFESESISQTSFVSEIQPVVSPIDERKLRRVQSFSSFESGMSHRTNKAPYFENLVTGKLTTKLMSQFVKKVTLDPLAQLVKPQRPKRNTKAHRMSP
ncbi:hypothetical protein BY458DRAFT_531270 [Sporodiniella umbellata]|nr:hypothetical protein BY458DRAFT_531270 [Sporodiniella umbellata]